MKCWPGTIFFVKRRSSVLVPVAGVRGCVPDYFERLYPYLARAPQHARGWRWKFWKQGLSEASTPGYSSFATMGRQNAKDSSIQM